MFPKIPFKRILFSLLAGMMLVSAACAQATPQVVVVEVTRLVPQTVVVTQAVTPAEPTAAPATEAPAQTELPTPRPTPTTKPISSYFPIEGCSASRLHMNEKARVSSVGGRNAIRSAADTSDLNIIGYAEPGDTMTIIGGPECSYTWVMWKVRLDKDGTEGWTPEGNGTVFWLDPVR